MLLGVEQGYNQILESMRPAALNDLFEKYNFPNMGKKRGNNIRSEKINHITFFNLR